jgi:hypothetical protein
VQWWVDRMIVAEHPAAEKLAWFWHGHFATSIDKVKVAALMSRQHQIFRRQGTGDFTALTSAVAQDSAMLRWLDADTNLVAHPNENFARELMELFTLGIGNYNETDVKEAARTFTGWSFDRGTLAFVERPRQHDRGTKTILGQTGDFDGLDTIQLLTATDASARFVAARMWSRYARPVDPADPVVTDLAAAWGASRRADVLLRAVLTHPQFATDATRWGLVKQPVEWAVGAVRAFGFTPDTVVAGKVTVGMATTRVLAALGQTPFRPPSVGGWPAQAAWLNTAADQLKLTFRPGHRPTGAGHPRRPGTRRRCRPSRPPGLAAGARRVAPGDGRRPRRRGRRPRHPRHVRAHVPRLRPGLKELRWPCPDAPSSAASPGWPARPPSPPSSSSTRAAAAGRHPPRRCRRREPYRRRAPPSPAPARRRRARASW